MSKTPLEEEASAYVDAEKGVESVEDAIGGAKDILAEFVSDNADYRKHIRELTMKKGRLVSAAKDPEAESVYESAGADGTGTARGSGGCLRASDRAGD